MESTRRIVMFNWMTANGYFAGADGNLDWIVPDEAQARAASIVSQLTQHGLIDEYQMVVCPIFLGSGRPLLTGVSKNTRLKLVEAKPYRSGDVMLRYARSS